MNTKLLSSTMLALLVLLLCTSIAASQSRAADDHTASQAPLSIETTVNSRISFQGTLIENGQPVNGNRTLIFGLYSDSNCATQFGADITKSAVPVTEGQFSVQLDVPQATFNGQAVHIQMNAGGSAQACWEILPTPYALSLRPGAKIIGDTENVNFGSILDVSNTTSTSAPHYAIVGRVVGEDARAILGISEVPTGVNTGVYGYVESTTDTARGVFGRARSTSGITYGVYGQNESDRGRGVFGEVTATTGPSTGVYGTSASESGLGVYGLAESTSGSRRGVVGSVEGTGYGLWTGDDLYVGGACTGCTTAFAALNAEGGTLHVGDAVAVSGVGPMLQGHTTPLLKVRAATAADASVLGVVYMRAERFPASDGGPETESDVVQPVTGDIAPGDYLFIATSGLAQVRVSKDATELMPGAPLAVAGTDGLVRSATVEAKPELVFARAMESEADEQGLVWAMIE